MVCRILRNLLLGLLFCGAAQAASIEQPLADAAKEQTARTIFHALKCVVCEGQSLAESDAELARQMRAHIRGMLQRGDNEQQVIDYFSSHYGEQILLTPRVEKHTALLWGAPLLLLLAGAAFVWRMTRPGAPA